MPGKRSREHDDENNKTRDKKHMMVKTFTRSNGTVWTLAIHPDTGLKYWARIR